MKVSGLARNVGIKSGYRLSKEALAALQAGDVNALMEAHRGRWNATMMADDNGDDDDDSNDDDDTGGGDGKKKSGDSGSGDDDDDDDDAGSDDDDNDTVSRSELERMRKRMQAADKRASEAEARLRKIDDADKSELQKAQDKVTEVETENTALKDQVSSLRLEVAFLSTNSHTWHKPGVALRLAQSEGYLEDVMGDDGKVDEKAMKKALDNLAKEHEYLVNKGSGSGGGSGSSGEPAGGRSKNGKDDKVVEDQDRRRAPALNRRR